MASIEIRRATTMAGPGAVEGYELHEILGRGGSATVYRATDLDHDRDVAVKILRNGVTEKERRAFDRERRSIGGLVGHPNVLPVFASGYNDDHEPYLVMELAEESLADRLRQEGAVPWAEAIRIGLDIAGAVAEAHAHGIRHRDIKPENVLISAYGVPKIADFGIASIASGTTTSTGVSLTLAHCAPETLDGAPPTDLVDVYSLASTLHHLITGASPFEQQDGQGVVAQMMRILKEDPPLISASSAPPEVSELLYRSLSKSPGDRPESMAVFRQLLIDASHIETRVVAADDSSGLAPAPESIVVPSSSWTDDPTVTVEGPVIPVAPDQSESVEIPAADGSQEPAADVDPLSDQTIKAELLPLPAPALEASPPRTKQRRKILVGASLLVAIFGAVAVSQRPTAEAAPEAGSTSTTEAAEQAPQLTSERLSPPSSSQTTTTLIAEDLTAVPAQAEIILNDNEVALSGSVHSEAVADLLRSFADDAYLTANITDNLQINDESEASEIAFSGATVAGDRLSLLETDLAEQPDVEVTVVVERRTPVTTAPPTRPSNSPTTEAIDICALLGLCDPGELEPTFGQPGEVCPESGCPS